MEDTYEHPRFASLMEAVQAKDSDAVAEFEKQAKSGKIIRIM